MGEQPVTHLKSEKCLQNFGLKGPLGSNVSAQSSNKSSKIAVDSRGSSQNGLSDVRTLC